MYNLYILVLYNYITRFILKLAAKMVYLHNLFTHTKMDLTQIKCSTLMQKECNLTYLREVQCLAMSTK